MALYNNLEKYLNNHPIKKGLDNISVDYFLITDLEKIPKNTLGLYSWYFFPHSVSQEVIKGYSSIYNTKKFKVNLSNKLNDKYSGNVFTNADIHPSDEEYEYFTNKLYQDFFQITAINMSPPIYMGRSIDLRERLICHKDKISLALGSLWTSDNLVDIDGSNIEFDTELESNCFANRVATFFKLNFSEDLNFGISNFLIKVIYFENIKDQEILKQIESKYLKDIESYFLRTFKPILSIK